MRTFSYSSAYCHWPYCILAHQAVAALRKHRPNARRLAGGFPEWREDGHDFGTAIKDVA